MLFSFLIPNLGYNDYLFICLQSIFKQPFSKHYKFEVIVCDQSDNLDFNRIKLRVEKEFGKKIKLIHSNIKGLLLARHTLMNYAHGDYICFVDSDDYISNNYLSSIYNSIVLNRMPDIIITDYYRVDDSGLILKKNVYPCDIKDHILDYFLFTSLLNSVWRKCFKRSLYSLDSYYDFDTKNGEDWIFSYPLMINAKKIVFENTICEYLYRTNPNSMTHSFSLETGLKALSLKDNYVLGINMNKYQKRLYLCERIDNFSTIFTYLILNNKIKYKLFSSCASNERAKYKKLSLFKCKAIGTNKRLFCLLIRLKFYYILYLAYRLRKK